MNFTYQKKKKKIDELGNQGTKEMSKWLWIMTKKKNE